MNIPTLCELCEREAVDRDLEGGLSRCSWCGYTFEVTPAGQRQVCRDLEADAAAAERRARRLARRDAQVEGLVSRWHVRRHVLPPELLARVAELKPARPRAADQLGRSYSARRAAILCHETHRGRLVIVPARYRMTSIGVLEDVPPHLALVDAEGQQLPGEPPS